MKKKILLVLSLILLLSMPVFGEDVNVELTSGEIRINGTRVDNEKAKYPFLVYKDVTYFPMTWDIASAMGLATTYSSEEGLSVSQSNQGGYVKLDETGHNAMGKIYSASKCSFPIKVNGKMIDNNSEEYPLLSFRNITYFPMTWSFMVDEFGLESSWTPEEGLKISSDDHLTHHKAVIDPEIGQVQLNVSEWLSISTKDRAGLKIIQDDFYVSLEGLGKQSLINVVKLDESNYELKRDSKKVIIQVGSNEILVDGSIKLISNTIKDIDDMVYLPLDFYTVGLGESVTYVGKTQNKWREDFYHDFIEVKSPYIDKKIQEVKENFIFSSNIETFTLYAFMNFTGYDVDHKGFIHETRYNVVNELDKMNLNLTNNNYFTDKGFMPLKYVYQSRTLGPAPNFEAQSQLMEGFEDLPAALKEFYEKADIENLYEKYKNDYDEEIALFYNNSFSPTKYAQWINFLDLDVQKINIDYELLESHGTGYTLYPKDGEYEYKLTLGPETIYGNGVIGMQTFGVEYLHYITEPILNDMDLSKIEVDMDAIPEGTLAKSEFYNTPEAIIVKSLIRGMMAKLDQDANTADGWSAVNYWTSQGFILTQYFFDKFDDYKYLDGNFEEYIKEIILELE
ncbi:copper amine oxidase N-terminal domain-containing protein [Acidaminobacter sp. JC074]|uniref:stalk domain-containing protein n=1 Tax=Acidaminobacter sp. JC074 TaxID=2530199 RepID=UPI001F1134AE|nr:stalk domain-containing protein [Acidaminobacter sp. JC074]MCH4890874.1 copper amine oxidase N-terminal domain-containing protein [Acidaminobacter sp. JC074]